jgi:hypothetical protein
MAQFERFNANLEQHRGQPPQPRMAAGHPYSRSERNTTPVYDLDSYVFEDEQPRRGQFDGDSLSRSLRTQAPVFTAEITFSEFRRDDINYLRAINFALPDLLEGAPPPDAHVNTAYQGFQKKNRYLCVVMKHPIAAIALQNFQRDPSFKARVSPCSHAWRTLINHFDQRGVGTIVGLLAKLLDTQSET